MKYKMLILTYLIGYCNPLIRIMTWLLEPNMLYILILSISSGICSLKSNSNERIDAINTIQTQHLKRSSFVSVFLSNKRSSRKVYAKQIKSLILYQLWRQQFLFRLYFTHPEI